MKKISKPKPDSSSLDTLIKSKIVLNDAERDWFLALLDSDDEPNEALKNAAELYLQGKRDGETYRW